MNRRKILFGGLIAVLLFIFAGMIGRREYLAAREEDDIVRVRALRDEARKLGFEIDDTPPGPLKDEKIQRFRVIGDEMKAIFARYPVWNQKIPESP